MKGSKEVFGIWGVGGDAVLLVREGIWDLDYRKLLWGLQGFFVEGKGGVYRFNGCQYIFCEIIFLMIVYV